VGLLDHQLSFDDKLISLLIPNLGFIPLLISKLAHGSNRCLFPFLDLETPVGILDLLEGPSEHFGELLKVHRHKDQCLRYRQHALVYAADTPNLRQLRELLSLPISFPCYSIMNSFCFDFLPISFTGFRWCPPKAFSYSRQVYGRWVRLSLRMFLLSR
jgi:hypothetical protein